MKRIVAILFSLALLLAGLPLSATTVCTTPTVQPCCHCGGKSDCCAIQDTSVPTEQAPATPAPTFTQNDFNAVTWHVITLMTPPTPVDGKVSPVRSAAVSVSAVPLFARDCAFLI